MAKPQKPIILNAQPVNAPFERFNNNTSKMQKKKKKNTWDSNVVPHRSTNQARQCLTSLSRREAVLSLWYGPSC
jgi:hypothetical protein